MKRITDDTMQRLSDAAILIAEVRNLLADAIETDEETNAKFVAYRAAIKLTHVAEVLSPEMHSPEVAMSTLKKAWQHSKATWPKPWENADSAATSSFGQNGVAYD